MDRTIKRFLERLTPLHLLVGAGAVLLLCLCAVAGAFLYRPGLPGDGILFSYEENGMIGTSAGIYMIGPDGSGRTLS